MFKLRNKNKISFLVKGEYIGIFIFYDKFTVLRIIFYLF